MAAGNCGKHKTSISAHQAVGHLFIYLFVVHVFLPDNQRERGRFAVDRWKEAEELSNFHPFLAKQLRRPFVLKKKGGDVQ